MVGQDLDDVFEEGNKALANNNYDGAILAYNDVLKADKVSIALYYNLGTAYLGKEDIAMSIINFERALKLDPLDGKTLNNLEIAKSKISDRIYAIEPFFLSKYWNIFSATMSFQVWTVLSILSFILSIIGLYFFLLGRSEGQIKLGKKMMITFFLLFMLSTIVCINRYSQLQSDNYAILMQDSNRYDGPDERSVSQEAKLSRGLKVNILDSYQAWIQVSLPDLEQTWIESKLVERI
jgi:hypothetical protein